MNFDLKIIYQKIRFQDFEINLFVILDFKFEIRYPV